MNGGLYPHRGFSRRSLLGRAAGVSGAALLAATGMSRAHATPGRTFDAGEEGATGTASADATSAIQSALDKAAGGGVVTIPAGTYRTTKPLMVSDETTVQMARDAVILRDFGVQDTTGATFTNEGQWRNGNHGITITGGSMRTASPSAIGKHLGFRNMSGLFLDGVHLAGVYGDWNVALLGVDNALVYNLTIDSGTAITEDGIHVAAGRFITIANCDVRCGDDAISIAHEFPELPDIEDVVVEDCTFSSARANGIRILTTNDGEVRNVELRGLRGSTDASHGLLIEDLSGRGLVHDVVVDDLSLDASRSGATAVLVRGVRNLALNRVSVGKALGRPFQVENSLNVVLRDCDGSPGLAGLQSVLARYSEKVQLVGFSSTGATQHGVVFEGITGGSIRGCKIGGARDAGIQLSGCTDIRVLHTSTGNATWGVRLDGANDRNQFLGNDFTGNQQGAVTGAVGASDRWFKNAGV